MNQKQEKCHFKVGDTVIYKPSSKGYYAMVNETERLVPGMKYVIAEIRDELYVLVEDYHHPGGGIYWTEFTQ